jgi:predicted Zn-dependent peptidase
MSLWVDAGSFDAESPAVATVAAFAATHGTGVSARVLPDGTELGISCESERVEACVDALAGALATRSLGPEALSAALVRLRTTRRGARRDPGRNADRLALSALFGSHRGLDPLGSAEGDAAIGSTEIHAFLAAHWGPSRALFVAVGDADETRVRQAIASALNRAPRAEQFRAERSWTPQVGARVEIGDDAIASAALAVSDERAAVAIARRALAELTGGTASVFPFRGAEIVLVRGAAMEDVTNALTYARAVTAECGGEHPLPPDDPQSIAARVGTRWIARANERHEGGTGLGVVVHGGRGDSDLDSPDEALRSRVQAQADANVRDAVADPSFEGTASEQSASLESRGGARVRARYTASGRVAVSLAISSDARREPAPLHGQRAIIARLLTRCVGDSNAEFWVDSASIGVVLEAEPDSAFDAIERLTACLRGLPMGPALIEEARARAVTQLRADDMRLARVARAIAPAAPGLIASHGEIESLAAIRPETVRRAWEAMARESHVTMGIDGEVNAGSAARLGILGLTRLPNAPPIRSSEVSISISAEEIVAIRSEEDVTEAILTIRDPRPTSRAAEAGARAILASFVNAMNAGTRVVWARSGAGLEGAWIAVAVRGSEDDLAGLPTRLSIARHRAETERERALALALEQSTQANAFRSSTARERARQLATASDDGVPDMRASDDVARALLRAPPRWVIVRPEVDVRR